jgi:hypothetical protein
MKLIFGIIVPFIKYLDLLTLSKKFLNIFYNTIHIFIYEYQWNIDLSSLKVSCMAQNKD